MDTPAAPVGASVHYVNATGTCRAGTITEVHEGDTRDLRIHHDGELGTRRGVRFSASREPQTWHAFEPSAQPGCRVVG